MQTCAHCNKEYPEFDFETAGVINGKRYYRKKCRYCRRIDKAKLRKRNTDFINNYKRSKGCCKCNNTDYRVLDFHHTDDNKEQDVANISKLSINIIKREIAKCIVICSNCHRILHSEN